MLDRMRFTGAWRDYQARVLHEMATHLHDKRLHLVAAPGAGKTILGLEVVRQHGRPALIFSPTVAIREQWCDRLCPLFLPEPPSADEISRDLSEPRELTLATYQALDVYRRGQALDALVGTLNARGPWTLVLDEAHHLRREWWNSLEVLATQLTDVRILALTATPPYDASFVEWTRYESLCGAIDFEIGIPELVRNGDLCPHQDHVILSEPTKDAMALLEKRRSAIAELQRDLRNDAALLDALLGHPWLVEPRAHVEAILETPEILSAALVHLRSAGCELPPAPLELLGASAEELPVPSNFWLERLLDGLAREPAPVIPTDPSWLEALRRRLHRNGLLEGGRVRLRNTRSIFRLLTNSLGKLASIVEIAAAEKSALADDLRMVILSDHIRAEELPQRSNAEFVPAKLGVVPIFEALRRAAIDSDHLAVLTGSLVIVPKTALVAIQELAPGIHLDPAAISHSALPGCPEHVRLEIAGGHAADLVRLVTALFEAGRLRILVGTQSLLGEGWDAPSLNSLVLASNTATFMLSNQMRGRAIRIDPDNSNKVANIWHLATVQPDDPGPWAATGEILNWGYLLDGEAGLSDTEALARRFKAFEGISNGGSSLIESGIARLGIDLASPTAVSNRHTLALASDRSEIARRWQRSLGEGTPRSRVRETAVARYAPRHLSRHDTLHALAWSAAGSGALAAANALRGVETLDPLGTVGLALAGAAMLASLPRLVKAGYLIWRNGSLERSLESVGRVVLGALYHAGIAGADELNEAKFDIRTSLDGRKDVVLRETSRSTERQVMQAMAEVLGPIQNPRYILVRKSWLGLKARNDYHAVPAVFGARKELAEHFATLWRQRIGTSELVFTRTVQGRRLLLRARASSFASGFQRLVDRRSVWL